MSLAPLDLISAHPWRRAVFTTYSLSLSFFEAVILDAMVRGGGREALILADVQGVRASLSELGIPVKVNINSGGKPNGLPERK